MNHEMDSIDTSTARAVIFCSHSYWPIVGGYENWIFQVATRLVGKCGVYVITKRLDGSWPIHEVQSGIHIIRYQAPLPGLLPSRFLPFIEAWSIVKSVRTIASRSTHVVFNFFEPDSGQVYAARLLRRKLVQHVVMSVCGTRSEFSPQHLKMSAAQTSDSIVGLSNYALKAFGVSHPNAIVLYPIGQKPADFSDRAASFDSQQVLTVCRVHPRKKLETLVEIAQQLPHLSFVVAGDYSLQAGYHDLLIAKMGELEVKNVHFLGHVDDSHLQRLYSQSALFFLPTSHEMFGLVFGEAMSYGLPVVAPRHTAIPEAVGVDTGLLYEPGDLDACRRGIEEILSSYERWTAFSKRAKSCMEERYAQDYIGRYANLLATVV